MASGGRSKKTLTTKSRKGMAKVKPASSRSRKPRGAGEPPSPDLLHRFEEVFQDLLQTTSVAFFATDAQGRLTTVSASVEAITSSPPEQLIGRHFSDFIHPQDLPHLQFQFERLAQGSKVQDEYRVVTPSGGTRWVLSSSKPVFDRKKAFSGIVGVLTDVHRGHTIEETFRETEEQFRTTFDLAGVGIAHLSPDWTWLRANETLCEIIGYPLQDLLTMRFADITHEQDRRADTAGLDRLTQGVVQTVTREKRVLRKDGFTVSVNCTVSAIRDPVGAVKYYIAIVEDITGRKRLEDTLQLLRTAVESIPLGITVANLDGRIVYVNPAEGQMHGYRPEELLGREARILAPTEQWSALSLKELIEQNRISDVPFVREGSNVRKDGASFPVTIHSVPVRDLRGAPLGLVSVAEDITERKKMLDALKASEQRYRSLVDNSLVGVFISTVDGRLVYVNDAHAQLAGYGSPSEMMAVQVKDLYRHPGDRQRMIEDLRRDGRVSNFEFEHLRKDGSAITVLISASLNGDTISGMMLDISQRKAYEQRLRDSEERFREIADLLPQPVFETDMNGMVSFANRSAFAQFGYVQEDLIKGMSVFYMLAPQDRDRARQYVGRLLQGGGQTGNEYTAQRKDGSTFPVVIYSAPIVRNGAPAGIRGVILDITDRKRAEEDNRIRAAILEIATDAVLLVDTTGKLLYFNDALCTMTGYSRTELTARNLQDIEPPEYAARVPLDIQNLMERGEAVFDSAYQKKDGTHVSLEVHARMTEYGGGKAVLSVVRDITDRKRTEEVLAMAKQDWESTFDTITDMITIHDEEFNIIRSNKAAADILGLPWVQMGRAKCYEFYHGADAPPAGCPSCLSLKTRQPSVEERFEPHLGRYLEIRAIPRLDDNGNVRGLIHVVRDITTRRKAEEERERLEARLRDAEKLQVIGSLAGGVAHEVRNPLNAIMALTDALDREVGGNPEYHTFMHHMRTQVERLSTLMTDLLELGKPVERSRLRTERLADICVMSLDAWRQSRWGRRREVELAIAQGGERLVLDADGKKLQQVFINLLDNAAQHSEEGSPLTLTMLKGHGSTAQVSVIDRGSGIPEDILPKVFDTFFTTRRGGTGLGLSIVKHIVELHGGAITLSNNEPPPGSTATVILPVKEDAA